LLKLPAKLFRCGFEDTLSIQMDYGGVGAEALTLSSFTAYTKRFQLGGKSLSAVVTASGSMAHLNPFAVI
jgi:hypothetical protein